MANSICAMECLNISVRGRKKEKIRDSFRLKTQPLRNQILLIRGWPLLEAGVFL